MSSLNKREWGCTLTSAVADMLVESGAVAAVESNRSARSEWEASQ